MILVTGATGFLGSELVRQLVAAGERVRILRRETSPLTLLGDAAAAVQHALGDVTDPDSLDGALDGVEALYHAAAHVGFGGPREHDRLHEVNVVGTANVVDAAREARVSRLLHVSSMAAFGRTRDSARVLDETSGWTESKYNTAYARSKYLSEREVHRGIAEGLDALIVNPALLFGPGGRGAGTDAIVARARRGSFLAPAGGTNVVDVADVAAGMRLAMAKGRSGERYFLGSENLTWMEILSSLARALGARPPRLAVPPGLALAAGTVLGALGAVTRRRPLLTRETARISSRVYRYSNAKAVSELGYAFRPFEETARRIAAHA